MIANLRGHVDRVDKMIISGWALSLDDPEIRPEIDIVQSGEVVLTVRPAFPFPGLRKALSLEPSKAPPIYSWRLWLPLSNGLKADLPFSVVFRQNAVALTLGKDICIPSRDRLDHEALSDLEGSPFMFPSYKASESAIEVGLHIVKPSGLKTLRLVAGPIVVDKGNMDRWGQEADPKVESNILSLTISHDDLLAHNQFCVPIRLIADGLGERLEFHNSVRTIQIPKTVADKKLAIGPFPSQENIVRVSGNTSNELQYVIGGVTTFLQLNLIASKFFGRSISSFDCVVDWGVGCARVMRHFWELGPHIGLGSVVPESVIGIDIDQLNVDWCRKHLPSHGQYRVGSFDGFELPDESVDFLYGISVMTHLSEHHQHLWLGEIRRILKPGGGAILTTHGEGVLLRQLDSIAVPFVDKFGFFDGIPDVAIGEEMAAYYRASYHSRAYIRNHWSKYLKILDFIPQANHFSQDFVVLQKAG